ncbi:hypothetical protein [Phocaeicola sp.]
MKPKKKLLIILLIFIAISSYILFFCFSFQQGKNNIRQKIAVALQSTISQDYYKRCFEALQNVPQPLKRKIKGTKLITKNRIEFIHFKDSIEEQLSDQLIDQYIFATFLPINPNTFNKIFKDELAKQGIADKTGIIYRYKGKPQYSENDSIRPRSALRSRIKMLDIKKYCQCTGMGRL